MDPLAKELNETLEGTSAGDLLSPLGRRMFFPKGIVAQSAEAKQKATLYNATIGTAVKDGQPMYLTDIYDQFNHDAFKPSDIFSYAPGGGVKELRTLWKAEQEEKNPTMKGKKTSLPIVTSGLTHGLSCVCQLFSGRGDTLVLPDLAWDNYSLMFSALNAVKVRTFPLYDAKMHFNVKAMEEAIRAVPSRKVRILLNFPNNPTGYTPTVSEMKAIAAALKRTARDGYKLAVITDDAYFGLFFGKDTCRESIFSYLCDADPNIFAIKCDGATKEAMVWGFRIGFVSFGCKGMTDEQYAALEKKMMGMIRATVSNCDHPGQSLVLHAMKNRESYLADKKKVFEEIKGRADAVREALKKHASERALLAPYPFNSGYFMAFKTKGDAEDLRRRLLDVYHVGAINIAGKTLRLAYCSVEKEKIPDLIDILYKAAKEIWSD